MNKFNNIEELIAGLSVEEREQFKELIEESRKRKEDLNNVRKQTHENLKKITANFKKISDNYQVMVVGLKSIVESCKKINYCIDELNSFVLLLKEPKGKA